MVQGGHRVRTPVPGEARPSCGRCTQSKSPRDYPRCPCFLLSILHTHLEGWFASEVLRRV